MRIVKRRVALLLAIFILLVVPVSGCDRTAGNDKTDNTENTGSTDELTEDTGDESVSVGTDAVEAVYTEAEAAETVVLRTQDMTVCLDEVLIYMLRQLYSYGVNSETLADYEDSCREEVLSQLVSDHAVSAAAAEGGFVLTDEDVETANAEAADFMEVFGGVAALYGISEEAVRECFYTQYMAKLYASYEKSILSESINSSLGEEYAGERFMAVYCFTFPTIQMNSENMPVMNENNEYIKLTSEERTEIYDRAEEARSRVMSGEDAAEVAEAYGISAYSSEMTACRGLTADELNEELYALENGQTTGVMEDEYAYVFYLMTDKDNADLKAAYIYSAAAERLETEYAALEAERIEAYGDFDEALDNDVWMSIDLFQMSELLEEKGIVSVSAADEVEE